MCAWRAACWGAPRPLGVDVGAAVALLVVVPKT